MLVRFINALAENMADVFAILTVIGVLAGTILYVRARSRHVRRLRAELRREVPGMGRVKEALAKIFNVSTAEVATAGAVTFVDIAWQYSMADPQIWDHFQGPAADHVADAIQNLDVLQSSLGEHSSRLFAHVVETLNNVEATQLFNDIAERLPLLESAGSSTEVALKASSQGMIETLSKAGPPAVEAKIATIAGVADAAPDGGLLYHLPLITMGFATYRAWRRAQQGTGLKRNLEFASIEVATRAGGGIVGGQVGGVIGTMIAPGVGTLLGGVAGAIAGTIGGMKLGDEIKHRHVRQAKEAFDASLEMLGRTYLEDPVRFRDLTGVFTDHEREYVENLKATKRRLVSHALPLRFVWPDEKLVLLQETVALAERRLGSVKQGTIDAIDRLTYMREVGQNHELGVILWSNPALRDQLDPDPTLVKDLEVRQDKLQSEVAQMGGDLKASAAA